MEIIKSYLGFENGIVVKLLETEDKYYIEHIKWVETNNVAMVIEEIKEEYFFSFFPVEKKEEESNSFYDNWVDDFYDYKNTEKGFPIDESIVFEIMEDLLGRRGFRQNWSMIDEDIKNEIFTTLIKKTKVILKRK